MARYVEDLGLLLPNSLLDLIQHDEDVYRLPGQDGAGLAIMNMVRESGQQVTGAHVGGTRSQYAVPAGYRFQRQWHRSADVP